MAAFREGTPPRPGFNYITRDEIMRARAAEAREAADAAFRTNARYTFTTTAADTATGNLTTRDDYLADFQAFGAYDGTAQQQLMEDTMAAILGRIEQDLANPTTMTIDTPDYAAECEHEELCDVWIDHSGQSVFICKMTVAHLTACIARLEPQLNVKGRPAPKYVTNFTQRIQEYVDAMRAELARRK